MSAHARPAFATAEWLAYTSFMLDLGDIAPETPRPLRREEYERIVELGLFEDERVELLYGVVVQMTPIGPPHCDTLDRLTRFFVLAFGERARVRVQGSFAASEVSEPEPDLAVVPERDYHDAHPDRAYLVVEVAETSLRKDRGLKARLYAESNVDEYWVVNLVEGCVEVFRKPDGGRYTEVFRAAKGDTLGLTSFPDVAVEVSKILR